MPGDALKLGSILVVDDDSDMRVLLKTLVSMLGYEVEVAEDGEQAIGLLKQQRFDLVITDLEMPNVDGMELLEMINTARLDTNMLVVSGVGSIPKAVQAVKLGAVNYIQKPVDPKTLKDEVRAVFRQRAARPRFDSTTPARSPAVPSSADHPDRIGRYEIVKWLGSGGMGVVYEAFDPQVRRAVALKAIELPTSLNQGAADELYERFRREAWAGGQLQHPGIIAVHDFGTDSRTGAFFLVMELFHGTPLSHLIRDDGPFSPARALRIAYQVADALEFAHRRNIIHRDVKPSNVLVAKDDSTKILDFGVARLPNSDLTQPGIILGSPPYVSPEAARGETIDYRADQFCLGAVLLEMLSGKKLFFADSLVATLKEVLKKPTPRLSELGVAAPSTLQPIVDRLLAKTQQDRYSDEIELLGDLERAGRELGLELHLAIARPPAGT